MVNKIEAKTKILVFKTFKEKRIFIIIHLVYQKFIANITKINY